jgi:dihydroorotate dehydrogenase (NAD+) catalytic subunit
MNQNQLPKGALLDGPLHLNRPGRKALLENPAQYNAMMLRCRNSRIRFVEVQIERLLTKNVPPHRGDLHALTAMQSAGRTDSNRIQIVATEHLFQCRNDGNRPLGRESLTPLDHGLTSSRKNRHAGFLQMLQTVRMELRNSAAAANSKTKGAHDGHLTLLYPLWGHGRYTFGLVFRTTIGVPDLSINLATLRLANPMLTCSGTCGYAFEYADFMDLSRLGAFVTKSITREQRPGNEPARIVETRAGMLNAIGLANVGLDRFLKEKVPLIRKMPCPVIVNVAGHSFDDYIETCAAMDGLDCIAGVELNVSCPNVADGLTFGTHPGKLKELTAQVKKVLSHKPLMVKLSPNVEDITTTARAAVDGGADVLTLINTFTAMAIDIHRRKPRLANTTGGLSGPAIKPIALHLVSRVYRTVAKPAGVPIVGMGGVQYWQDAVEFILAGASVVAVGTALFVDPAAPNKILDGLTQYMETAGVKRLTDLVGELELPGKAAPATPYP